jgi:hypothetical protein
MKTDRQIGSTRQHLGKPARGLPRPCVGRLIANLELEFSSTHRKRSPLKIPNRKFSRVSRTDFSNLGITSSEGSDSEPSNSTVLPVRSSPVCQPPATAILIHGSAIKSLANSQGFNNVRFSNRRLSRGKPLPCGRSLRPQFLVSLAFARPPTRLDSAVRRWRRIVI